MKYLITGDRKWTDYEHIRRILFEEGVGPGDVVVHGAARGADTLAGRAAQHLGAEVVAVPADWKKWGKAAGSVRNQQMLDEHPDIERVLAFHSNIKASKGTADMIRRAKRKKLPVRLEPPQGQQELF